MAVATAPVSVEIPAIGIQTMEIILVGDSSLICNKWSEKAMKQILDKQTKKAKGGREAKDLQRDFEASTYRLPNGKPAFPANAFKSAAVTACTSVDGMTKVQARQAFHVVGDLIEIDGTPTMRVDMVRVGMGKPDIRARAEFKKWSVTLSIRHNTSTLSPSQIINLFNIAGFGVGVGEWRPEKDGSFGMFHVATEAELNG